MSDFTLEDLSALLLECVGAPEEGMSLEGENALDTPFLEFGYDSLALLQITGVIERRHGIMLSDDAATQGAFLTGAAPYLSGSFEFFDGRDPRTVQPHTFYDAIYQGSLEQFMALRPLLCADTT